MTRIPSPPFAATLAKLAAASLVVFTPVPTRADASLEGQWRQSGLREEFTVHQWVDARCGPPPRGATTGGGELVTVRMEGGELSFVGGGRVYRTNQCYDPMPTLTRESHSRDPSGKSWRTQCRTPPADPRKAMLNTLVAVTTEARIELVETGRYEITTEGGRCIADVKRTRTFERVRGEAAPAPTPPAEAATGRAPSAGERACAAPGAPARLEVRPSKKLVRAGDTFRFRALVLDANGCDTRTATRWQVASGAEGVRVDATGAVTIASDAPEGAVEIVVTAAGRDARVSVEVASPTRYDELLARSGLNSAGESDDAATATIASHSLGAGESHVEDRSRQRRLLFMAIIGALLLALGAAMFFVMRRARRAKALLDRAEEQHQARVGEVLERRRRREEEHAAQMRAHLESLAAARAAPAQGSPQTELPSSAAPAPQGAPARGKICPRCGERFDASAEFCGRDGAQLVLVN